jgi:D-xylulose kinase
VHIISHTQGRDDALTAKRYFIGVDVGTQSTKTLVVDGADGAIVGRASQGYGYVRGLPPGWKEQNPAVWVDAVTATLAASLRVARVDPKTVRAVGVSAQQHGFVPLDADGAVIRPAKLWNDTSTARECEDLTATLGGPAAVIARLGNPLLPGYTAGKILWLRRHEPERYARLATVLLPHDYLNFHLTGVRAMEYGDASGTGLMDVTTRTWSRPVVDAIDPALLEKLPPLRPSDSVVGVLRPGIAARFGFADDTVVSAGGGDNMMAAIGTGNTAVGVVTASLGTSGTIYAYSDVPRVDADGEIAAFCDSTNAWLPLCCTMNVTVATERVRQLFALSHEALTTTLGAAPVGADGLLLLPYLEGERTPNVPSGTGVLYGLRGRTLTPSHLVRATVEGVTLGMNYGLNRMRRLGIEPAEIRLTGGGSRNPAWRQIAADVFDAEVVCLTIDEGAAYGAALQAMWAHARRHSDSTSVRALTDRFVAVDEATRARPTPANVERYSALQRIHDQLSRDLRASFATHRAYLRRDDS